MTKNEVPNRGNQALARSLRKHVVEETQDASRRQVTEVASKLQQLGLQLLKAFPVGYRNMQVKELWGHLEADADLEKEAGETFSSQRRILRDVLERVAENDAQSKHQSGVGGVACSTGGGRSGMSY